MQWHGRKIRIEGKANIPGQMRRWLGTLTWKSERYRSSWPGVPPFLTPKWTRTTMPTETWCSQSGSSYGTNQEIPFWTTLTIEAWQLFRREAALQWQCTDCQNPTIIMVWNTWEAGRQLLRPPPPHPRRLHHLQPLLSLRRRTLKEISRK